MKNFVILVCFLMVLAAPLTALGVDYETIRDNMKNMTDLQWDQYSESLKGYQIDGDYGLISNVKEKNGKYRVEIDQYIYLWNVPKDKAYSLRKSQEVYYYGTIHSVNNIFGRCVINLIYGGIIP